MSGICGTLYRDISVHDHTGILERMCHIIRHRGPHACNTWVDADAGIAVGNQYLVPNSTSPNDHPPIQSVDGRFILVNDGRIYNSSALRVELEALGHSFTTTYDETVMLAAIHQWGLQTALQKFEGVFALALWDRLDRTLSLARDHVGMKPLYYGWIDGVFLFGSQLKSLQTHPVWRGEVHRGALALFLRYDYIPAPYSIWKDIYKLQPGTILTITPAHARNSTHDQLVPYWSARQVAQSGIAAPFSGTETEAIDYLDHLLRKATAAQIVTETPHATFLSGGVDSSTVAAMLQLQHTQPIKTFTMGFPDASYDEAIFSKEVARHLGTEHYEHYLTPEEVVNIIPTLPTLYDEPFADASEVPTLILAQIIRQHTWLCFSGDGSDDLFGGHRHHKIAPSIWNSINKIPATSRYALARALTAIPVETLDKAFNWLIPLSPQFKRVTSVGDRLHKRAAVFAATNEYSVYDHLISDWRDACSVVIGACEPSVLLTDKTQWDEIPDFLHRMLYLDLMTWLPDDLLVKMDRATMGVGLEVRMPFLDRRIIEFAWTTSPAWKFRDGQDKWLLRQVLYRYVPKELIERPKTGFEMPLDKWLRGPLRQWADELLDEQRLRDEGFFQVQPVRQKWSEHLSGCRDWDYHLWNILMFQEWFATHNISRYSHAR